MPPDLRLTAVKFRRQFTHPPLALGSYVDNVRSVGIGLRRTYELADRLTHHIRQSLALTPRARYLKQSLALPILNTNT